MSNTFIPVANSEMIVGFTDRRGPAKMAINVSDISHFYEICHSPLKVKIVLRSSPDLLIVTEGAHATGFLRSMGVKRAS